MSGWLSRGVGTADLCIWCWCAIVVDVYGCSRDGGVFGLWVACGRWKLRESRFLGVNRIKTFLFCCSSTI